MDGEAKPYLLTEAAELTGLSVDALRKRIERKRLRGSRSNEDGQLRVWLTSKDVETAKAGRFADRFGHGSDSPGQRADSPTDESLKVRTLEDSLDAVREDLSRERARVAAAEGEGKALREERNRLLRERDAAQAEAAALRAERETARISAARSEATLEEIRKPWWRRWTG
jgi:chromosome segregation ATPase